MMPWYRFEREVYDRWLGQVDEACSFNLDLPLITRDVESNTIAVNFAPEVRMLCVKFLPIEKVYAKTIQRYVDVFMLCVKFLPIEKVYANDTALC